MAVAKLFVAAVAALSFTLPVVSAPIPRFDSPSLQFYHARSHHVVVAEHKRDLAARGADLSSTSSELKRGGDEADEDCSETDSEDGDDDETCPEGYELEEVDEADDEDCSDVEEDDDVVTEDTTKSVKKVDGVVDLNNGKTTLTTTVTTTSRPTTTSKPPAAAKKTSSTTSATPTPTPKASNSNKSNTTSPVPAGQFSGTGTWYEQHGVAGACGKKNPDSAFIGAMNGAQFKGSCGKQVLIKNKANGKTVTITIADECPSKYCKHGNIDLSVAAFKAISSLDKGVVDMEWSFV